MAIQDCERVEARVCAERGPRGPVLGGVDRVVAVAVARFDVGSGGEEGKGEGAMASVGGKV